MFAGRLILWLALAVCVVTLPSWTVRADDKKLDETSERGDNKTVQLSDDIRELLAFVKDLPGYPPKNAADLEARRRAARGKSSAAVEAALEKIHQIATEDDKQLPGYDDAMGLRLIFRTIIFGKGPRAGSPQDQAQLIKEIARTLAASPAPSKNALSAAMKVVLALELNNPKQAVEVYREFGGILVKSHDPQAALKGTKMEGAARRLELVGKPFELSGTLMNGTKLDWTKYRGKVVLVDFWATWCGPCLREFPNVKENYERYGARGFEVIGVSIDEDREALEKFLTREQHPWETLHDGGLEDSPVAIYYGITAASTMLLVDREGKVVSLDARGPELTRKLATLLDRVGTGEIPEKPPAEKN